MTRLQARVVFRNEAKCIIVVESLNIRHHRVDVGLVLFGKLEPTAIVIKNTNDITADITAINLENEQLNVDDLMCSVPGLENIVNGD